MGSRIVNMFTSQGKAWALESDANPCTEDPHCISVSFSVNWDNNNNNNRTYIIVGIMCQPGT